MLGKERNVVVIHMLKKQRRTYLGLGNHLLVPVIKNVSFFTQVGVETYRSAHMA